MVKKPASLLMVLLLALSMLPAFAGGYTLTTGDVMVVTGRDTVPMYASYHPYDYTVITYVRRGETVMFIAGVDRGYCVAYQNFVGYIDDGYLQKVSSYYYYFELPDGSAYANAVSSSSAQQPGNNWQYSPSFVTRFPYRALTAYPNQEIATRSGPGTNYLFTGTYPQNLSYSVYYQTKGGSVNWGYMEFTYNNKKYRLYTGVKRFSTNAYLDYCEEDYSYVTVNASLQLYFGPGYEYAQGSCEKTTAGQQVKAFFEEDGWAFVEYTLSNGVLHRGWVPPGYWY